MAGVAACSLLVPAACSAQGGGKAGAEGGQGAKNTSFTYLGLAEDSTISGELTALSQGACSTENKALPLKLETVATANVVQKITLLASQNALPPAFVAGTAMIRPDGDLGTNHLALDYEQALKKLGKWKDVNPAAANTIKQIYGGMYSLPYQYNIEGIWYNKAIFAKNGISEPQTWDELMAAMAKLKQAGVVPITQGGSDGWPLTRIIGMYLFREYGPNAIKDVMDGKAKLTDPGYVKGAQALADLAAKGYLGEGVVSRSQDAATSQFLTGKAAMIYNGSWMLNNINDSSQDKIGAKNIGLMPFPTVPGGVGTRDQWPANAGAPQAMSAKAYGPKVGAWLGCIADNYGTQAMKDKGIISGFTTDQQASANAPAMTKEVQKIVDGSTQSVLWFEAQMDSKTNALASQNVPLLITGKMSPQKYMAALQASIDANRGK